MAENINVGVDLGDAPDNKERTFVEPGFRKLKINAFKYEKEEDGKTPLIVMECTAKDGDGEDIEFNEKLYISGKLSKKNVLSSIVRLQELFKGLTGNKMTIKPTAYTYTKKEQNGTSQEFTIPNPQELCDYLNKNCAGKTAIFLVAAEKNEDGKLFSKLAFNSFLYYTDRKGDLHRYTEERDFTDAERKYHVREKKSEAAPVHAGGIADTKTLDEF